MIGTNVTIGKNSIIAAYSFVTKDVPSNELWSGVHAKFKQKILLKLFVIKKIKIISKASILVNNTNKTIYYNI